MDSPSWCEFSPSVQICIWLCDMQGRAVPGSRGAVTPWTAQAALNERLIGGFVT